MSRDKVIDSLGRIDDDLIQRVAALRVKKKKAPWVRWTAIAACLCLVAAIAIPGVMNQFSENLLGTSMSDNAGYVSKGLRINGKQYLASTKQAVSFDLPSGFSPAGKADIDAFKECPYYTNPDQTEWVYVWQNVSTDMDNPRYAYVRYVDVRLRGRDLVCCNGEYYISMWSVYPDGAFADVSLEYYNAMESAYGIRIEGEAFDGFKSVGIAEFTGFDTIPDGALASNNNDCEVYVNPNNPDIILVPTQWYTAPNSDHKEICHNGFDIFIRYDCPFVK